METRVHHNRIFASSQSTQNNKLDPSSSSVTSNRKNYPNPRDLVLLSKEAKTVQAGTQLISETVEELENGFRKKQEFEQKDGRKFTRIEDVIVNNNQSSRVVTQQNASGSTSRLEDVFDRQSDGSFRLTQRYTNEIGETSVNIEPNSIPPSADIVLGRTPITNHFTNQTSSIRGSELNVVI